MSSMTERLPATRLRAPHLRWLAVLFTGVALFGALLAVLVETRDPVFLFRVAK